VRSWGNKPACRTLIRMRSQVQVLPGPPAKALPERPPATPLDHLGPLGPAPAPTASVVRRRSGRLEVHTAAGHPSWVACYKIVRPYPQQQLRVVYRQVEDPAGSLAASTRPDLADRTWPGEPGSAAPAPKRPHSQEHTAHQHHHHKDNPDRFQRRHRATLDQVVVTGRDLARAARRWWPAPIDLEASGGPASGQRGAND